MCVAAFLLLSFASCALWCMHVMIFIPRRVTHSQRSCVHHMNSDYVRGRFSLCHVSLYVRVCMCVRLYEGSFGYFLLLPKLYFSEVANAWTETVFSCARIPVVISLSAFMCCELRHWHIVHSIHNSPLACTLQTTMPNK